MSCAHWSLPFLNLVKSDHVYEHSACPIICALGEDQSVRVISGPHRVNPVLVKYALHTCIHSALPMLLLNHIPPAGMKIRYPGVSLLAVTSVNQLSPIFIVRGPFFVAFSGMGNKNHTLNKS